MMMLGISRHLVSILIICFLGHWSCGLTPKSDLISSKQNLQQVSTQQNVSPKKTEVALRKVNTKGQLKERAQKTLEETHTQTTTVNSHQIKQRVAVLELNNQAQITAGEVSYLTDLIRKNAQKLPNDKFTVFTRENMIEMLPPDVTLESCIGECEIETGRRIGAHWVVTGEVIRFGNSLRISLNLHHSKSSELRGSSIVKGNVVEELEAPMKRATYELLTHLYPPFLSQLPADEVSKHSLSMFKLPQVDLSEDQELDLKSLADESSPLKLTEIKPIQMKTNLSELKIEALQLLDEALKGEKDQQVTPQEKIKRWEVVRDAVPEARMRAEERIAEWQVHLEQRIQKISSNLNKLDQKRRLLISGANQISRRLEQLANDFRAREQECSQNFEKLAKLVKLQLFSPDQKLEYILDFARGCAPFSNYLEQLAQTPYLEFLALQNSQVTLNELKRDALEAQRQFEAGRDELTERYRRRWMLISEVQEKIDVYLKTAEVSSLAHLLDESRPIQIGDKVRIKRSVTTPQFGWGQASYISVGILIDKTVRGEVVVQFPKQAKWSGLLKELEHASSEWKSKSDSLTAQVKAHIAEKTSDSLENSHPESLPIGTQVKRGVDWEWGNQDGGEGETGETISEVRKTLWVRVRWNHGSTNTYRWGYQGKYDLALVSGADATSQEDQLSQLTPKILIFNEESQLLGDFIYQVRKKKD